MPTSSVEGGSAMRGSVSARLSDALLPPLVAEEPVEALGLQCEEVGNLQGLTDLAERGLLESTLSTKPGKSVYER